MDKSVEFEVLDQDRVVCTVYNTGNGREIVYSGDKLDKCFCPLGTSNSDINKYYRERCFPETRVNKKQLLKGLGLIEYNPLLICKKTHGMFYDDTYWIRFPENGNLSYREARKEVGITRL